MRALISQHYSQRLSLIAILMTFLVVARLRPCVSFIPRRFPSCAGSIRLHSSSNHLLDVTALNNDFCALRHGQSMANVERVISSNPSVASVQHGLSNVGMEQATKAGDHVVDFYRQHTYDGIVILASDYKRAKETAEIVADCCLRAGLPLHKASVIIETRLRERWFGDWDGGSDEHYHDVWKDDAVNPSHTNCNVESVNDVMKRTSTCVLDWNANMNNHLIILVAHGDVLQITQTAFAKMDGSLHRTLEHLETATLRPLVLATR